MSTAAHAVQGSEPSPIEVWLGQHDDGVACTIFHEDETVHYLPEPLELRSIRGAQREVTGYFIDKGYEPVGSWQDETESGECSRQFKLK